MGDNITVAIGLEATAEAGILWSDSEVASGYMREVRSSSRGRVMSVSTMLFMAAMIPLAADSNRVLRLTSAPYCKCVREKSTAGMLAAQDDLALSGVQLLRRRKVRFGTLAGH